MFRYRRKQRVLLKAKGFRESRDDTYHHLFSKRPADIESVCRIGSLIKSPVGNYCPVVIKCIVTVVQYFMSCFIFFLSHFTRWVSCAVVEI